MADRSDHEAMDTFRDQLRERLARRQKEREHGAEVSPRRTELREAAAVLTSFDPAALQPVGGVAEPTEALTELADDAVVVEKDRDQSRWALLAPIRRQALQSLGTQQRMLEALEANPQRPRTTAQRIFEGYIRGDAPPLDEQDLPELEGALQAVRWLTGLIGGLPELVELRRRLEERRLYAPLEQLAGKHFGGRVSELQRLRDYVGLYPPERLRGLITRQLRRWAGLKVRAPFVIYGPGGVGKSTLIAKLVLDHGHPDNELRIPFAYLDFDNPTLVIDEPTTLLIEALRQVGIQYPQYWEACEGLSQEFQQELLERDTSLPPLPLDATSETPLAYQASELVADQRSWERLYIERFAGLVWELPTPAPASNSGRPPFLLVLDTFEEVQYRSEARVARLWEWLADLQGQLPSLRTVVSGRAPVRDLEVNGLLAEELELGDLDNDAAVGFLKARGITQNGLAATIVQQVGGNPLSLTLAAEVLRREGEDAVDRHGIKGIKRLSKRPRLPRLSFSIGEENIQGVLYRRILDHIKDPDVRRLAHPGLVLRRLTPDLIMRVLAGPCGIEVPDANRAVELFQALRREITLVSPAEDGSLRHRQDVRRLMLGPLLRDRPDQVRAIHQAAAAYYAAQHGDIARAEEIYHRLQLGNDPRELERLWTPGVGEYLRGAVDELSASGQVFLARHMNLVLGEDILRQAELEDWEQLAARRCRELLQSGNVEGVRSVLREREDRSRNSPLNLIEVVTLVALGNWEEAAAAVEKSLEEAEQAGDRQTVMRSCVALAHLADRSEALLDVDELLQRAGEIAGRLDDQVTILGVLLQRLTLRRHARKEDLDKVSGTDSTTLAGEADQVLATLPDATLKDDPELTRAAMAELGAGNARILRRGLRLAGLGPIEETDLVRLASAIAAVSGDSLESLGFTLAQSLKIPPAASPPWHAILVKAPTLGRLEEFLDRILDEAPGAWGLLVTVADIERAHTSWSLYLSVYASIAGLPGTGYVA